MHALPATPAITATTTRLPLTPNDTPSSGPKAASPSCTPLTAGLLAHEFSPRDLDKRDFTPRPGTATATSPRTRSLSGPANGNPSKPPGLLVSDFSMTPGWHANSIGDNQRHRRPANLLWPPVHPR